VQYKKENKKFRSFENANLLYKVINQCVSCVVLKEGKVHFKALKAYLVENRRIRVSFNALVYWS